VDVRLQTNSFDAKTIHMVSKNGNTILANNLLFSFVPPQLEFMMTPEILTYFLSLFHFITTKTKQQQTLKIKIVTQDIRENHKFLKKNSRYKTKIISTT